jgi:DNA polymerase (family 10)
MDRKAVARILEETAAMLRLKGESSFKVRAYQNAARAILAFPGDLGEAVKTRELLKLRGIGASIFGAVETLLTTGGLPFYEELRASFPPGLRECMRIPGLGAKKAKALYDGLGVGSLEALEKACNEGRLEGLPGFGPKSAERILRGIAVLRMSAGHFLYSTARRKADELLRELDATSLATTLSVAGSLRRRKETVRDVDILAASEEPEALAEAFRRLPDVMDVIGSGETKTSVRFLDGLAADLRVVTAEEYPAALLYFTGSKEHNTALRGRAKRMGLKLNEYGLFREPEGERLACAAEAEIYEALDLAYIEPELREDRGEIEAAKAGTLPRLVAEEDIQGLIHVHTTESDGRDTLEEMVRASRDAGYRYVAITDHSKTAVYAGGLTEQRVLAQREEIRRLRLRFPELRIFHGTEADILADGQVDFGDEFLQIFDIVVASVHSRFGLSEQEQTRRLLRAVQNPRVAILGHPTGRLLLERQGAAADMEKVIDAAAESGCALEVNGSPHRLDLDWRLCRRAIQKGVLLSIDPDAHSTGELAHTAYGVGVARKGWASKGAVLNAKGPEQLTAWLEERRGSPIPERAGLASG